MSGTYGVFLDGSELWVFRYSPLGLPSTNLVQTALMRCPGDRYGLYTVVDGHRPTPTPWTSHLWWTRFLLVVRDLTVSTAWVHKGSFDSMQVAYRWWIENLTLPQKQEFCQDPVPHGRSQTIPC